MITVKELISKLEKYPDDMDVRLETNKRSDIMSPLEAVWHERDGDSDFDGNPDYVVLSYS